MIELNNPKIVRAWTMYDWANSVYSLVITSAIFPVYYKSAAVQSDGSDVVYFLGIPVNSSVIYSYALSLSFLIVAAILPLLSGVADYTGRKKYFMKVFVFIGSFSCMGLYFFEGIDTVYLALAFSMLASIGYSGSLVFYDAFLPEIVTKDRYDATSARGYSMGYYGSVIMMIGCILLIENYSMFLVNEKATAVRLSFLLVGVWWLGFAFRSFAALPRNPYERKPIGKIWTHGYRQVAQVWKNLKGSPDLKRFLASFFFYNMGVQTIMYLATLFGTDVLHLPDDDLIMTVLIIQLVGALGAYTFARISNRKGNRFTLGALLSIWIAVCVSAYFIALPWQFFALAAVVGLVMGGVQSLSRATYSKLIPQDTTDHASYFSFYDVTFNLSIVVGTFSYGFVDHLTGSMRYSALVLALYFVVGLIMLRSVRAKEILRPNAVSNGGA